MSDSFCWKGLIKISEHPFLAKRPKSTVDRWLLSGTLEGLKIGGQWFTKEEWVEDFLKARNNCRIVELRRSRDSK